MTSVIRNEDIKMVIMEVPEGHKHLRTTIVLKDGRELILQEATVASITRAFITIKTHPKIQRLTLTGTRISDRKPDFAEWQLLENNGR